MKISGSTSKRENQILDLVYSQGSITATQLEAQLTGGPSNSAVRWHLRALEAKGLLTHREVEGVYVYDPTKPKETIGRGELARVLSSFFGGSVSSVMTTLLDQERDRLTADDLQELRAALDRMEKGEG